MRVASGLWSLRLGADNNRNLQGDRLSNALAFLHHKLGTDLAPAGFQSYFNPLPDMPFYLAISHLPPRPPRLAPDPYPDIDAQNKADQEEARQVLGRHG